MIVIGTDCLSWYTIDNINSSINRFGTDYKNTGEVSELTVSGWIAVNNVSGWLIPVADRLENNEWWRANYIIGGFA